VVSKPAGAPSLLEAERCTQFGFLLIRQVRADKLGLGVAELGGQPVINPAGTEHEKRRRAGRDLLPDFTNERVADPDIAQRAEPRPGGSADGRAQEREEKIRPNSIPQKAPMSAPDVVVSCIS